ncbi:MAG: PAS domain S-box protein [Nitrososphaerota archaeon]|jgi:PAS domain S-box-containing protein|nr:PAS domain S-box protein [Nitrososphaerota archaeon]
MGKEMLATIPDKQFRFIMSKLSEGIAYCKILTDEKKNPLDWIYLDVNDAYGKLYNLEKEEVMGKKATELFAKRKQDPTEFIYRYGVVALTGQALNTEHYVEACDKWYAMSVYSPQTGYFVIISEDITRYKKAKEDIGQLKTNLEKKILEHTDKEVKKSHHLYNVLETLPIPIALIDKTYRVFFVNRVFRECFGTVRGDYCYTYFFNRNVPCEKCETYKVIGTNKPVCWELLTHNNVCYGIFGFPFIDLDGSINILVAWVDITERKRDELDLKTYCNQLIELVAKQAEALRESEARWEATLNSICDAVIVTDHRGAVTFMNSVAENLTGWAKKDALGKPIDQVYNIINEQTRQKEGDIILRVLAQGHSRGLANQALLIRKDTTEISLSSCGAFIITVNGATHGVVLVFHDATEHKRVEEANKRQTALIELSPIAIIAHKIDGVITFWSKGAEKTYGWTKEEAVGKCVHELLVTKFPQPLSTIVLALKEKQNWAGIVIQKTKNGHKRIMQSWWLVEKTEQNEIRNILESGIDITERDPMEKEIARLASFQTLNPLSVFDVDFDGNISYTNSVADVLFVDIKAAGLNHDCFLGWKDIREAFKTKNTTTIIREVKINGHWYQQQFCLVPQTQQIRIYITDSDELKRAGQASIQTQQKMAENMIIFKEYASQMGELAEQRAQQLQGSERLAAIGQTAGMVGHDIRNPLQAITSDMYLISEEVKTMADGESKQAIMESIDSVDQNLAYINKIVSDLQDYTRPLRPNIQNANLSELILSTLLTISVPKDIKVALDIKQVSIPIKTDTNYIRRILTNLVTNAIQAMHEEGELTVKANMEDDVVMISVYDTGPGIPDEARGKMFTPLFTTKSKGQGLGLAVVKRLVDALNGNIRFESAEGSGTRFTVELPQTKI